MLLVPDAIKIENVNVLSCQNIDDSLIGGTFCCYLLKCEIVELILLIWGLQAQSHLWNFLSTKHRTFDEAVNTLNRT
jgi:hypothetical protein